MYAMCSRYPFRILRDNAINHAFDEWLRIFYNHFKGGMPDEKTRRLYHYPAAYDSRADGLYFQ